MTTPARAGRRSPRGPLDASPGATTVHPETWGAFEAFRLLGERLSVVVIPEPGGKVVSMADRASGREWLTQVDPASLRMPEPGRPWTDYDKSGWDECFPSVGPGVHPDPAFAGLPLQEQGELWNQPWRVLSDRDGLTLSVESAAFAYALRRRLTIHGPRLLVDYRVANRGDHPFPAMWAMHPLLAVPTGARLSGLAGDFRVDHAGGTRLRHDDLLSWPSAPMPDGTQLDLSVVPDRSTGVALKLFGPPPQRAVAIETADGWLAVQADPAVTDLGLWLNYGGWPETRTELFHLAIEASIGDADDLARVVRGRHALVIPPRGEAAWSVTLRVGSPDEPRPEHWRSIP